MGSSIVVRDLNRWYTQRRNRVHALRGIDLEIASGEVVGVLGVNGAGKTTLLKILATLLLPSSGTVTINGHDVAREPAKIRPGLSVVFGGERGLYNRLTARDNLEFFAALKGLPSSAVRADIDEMLEVVGLERSAHDRVETFSKGMKQRLHIAAGMLGSPSLILLDEPTIGLDPLEAERTRTAIGELGKRDVTVLVTSHYLHDIERVASRILLLQQGVLTHDLPVAAFISRVEHLATIRVAAEGSPPPTELVAALGGDLDVQPDGSWSLELRVNSWSADLMRAVASLIEGRNVQALEVKPTSLDDAFRALVATGRD